MRLKFNQLDLHLKNALAPIYLITGDEPLQLNEASDAIRYRAKQQSFENREIFSVDAGFEWHELTFSAQSLSLFADKKLIDLRISSTKIGVEGSKTLIHYCQHLPDETLLLITIPKLTVSTLKSKWCQAIDKQGAIIQIWTLSGQDLLQWLQQRSQKRGLNINDSALTVLASRIEGNLLAASQEIEKLYVLYGHEPISKTMIEQIVADNSRFDVYQLVDCLLTGKIKRFTHILNHLKEEGIAPSIIIWALAREVRLLIQIKSALEKGTQKEQVFQQHHVWDKRKQLINQAMTRINPQQLQHALFLNAHADQQVKGQQQGDCWETFLAICLLFIKTN